MSKWCAGGPDHSITLQVYRRASSKTPWLASLTTAATSGLNLVFSGAAIAWVSIFAKRQYELKCLIQGRSWAIAEIERVAFGSHVLLDPAYSQTLVRSWRDSLTTESVVPFLVHLQGVQTFLYLPSRCSHVPVSAFTHPRFKFLWRSPVLTSSPPALRPSLKLVAGGRPAIHSLS